AETLGLSGSAGSVSIAESTGLNVNISNAEPANDTLTVNTSAGDDLVSASSLANSSVKLTINGGADDDILVGSDGNDTINGDAGNDLIRRGAVSVARRPSEVRALSDTTYLPGLAALLQVARLRPRLPRRVSRATRLLPRRMSIVTFAASVRK